MSLCTHYVQGCTGGKKQMLKLLLSYRVGKIMVPYRVHSGSHYYGPSNLGYPKSDDNVDNAQTTPNSSRTCGNPKAHI